MKDVQAGDPEGSVETVIVKSVKLLAKKRTHELVDEKKRTHAGRWEWKPLHSKYLA